MKIDGRAIQQTMLDELRARRKPDKSITALLARETPGSFGFIKQKEKIAEKLGVPFRVHYLETDDSTESVVGELKALAIDEACGGIIVQLPLPERFDIGSIADAIPEEKDIDALGKNAVVLPPAAAVVKRILALNARTVHTLNLAVVGRGRLVGEPIARLLGDKARTFTPLHRGDDLAALKDADVVVLGVGVPHLIDPDILKRGAGVIDFGYGRDENGNLAGDLDTRDEKKLKHLSFWTPTPGGTGPILIAELFNNFYELNK